MTDQFIDTTLDVVSAAIVTYLLQGKLDPRQRECASMIQSSSDQGERAFLSRFQPQTPLFFFSFWNTSLVSN